MAIFPPKAKKIPFELTAHGHKRIDNYYWLNDRTNKDVLAYLEAENEYTGQALQHLNTLREDLFSEMKGRIKEQDESVPFYYNGYHYFLKYVKGGEYPVYCRSDRNGENESVLLDCNEAAKEFTYFHCPGVDVSPDNKIGMMAVDCVGRRIYELRFKDLESDQFLTDRIMGVTGNAVWANDNKSVFYSVQDEVTLRSFKIMKHVIGTPVANDTLIYEELDVTYNCTVAKSKSEKYIFINSFSTRTTECRFISADLKNNFPIVFEQRRVDHEYTVDHINNEFYIVTNDHAKNFRLMKANELAFTRRNWQEVIPHRKDVLLEGIELFNEFKVISERINGLPAIRVLGNDGIDYYIDFGEVAYNAFVSINPEANSSKLRFVFNSLITPNTTYEFDMYSRERKLLKQQEVVGGYDRSLYTSERIMIPVRDGAMVPASIVYRNDLYKKDGQSPLLQYGYGSYGYSLDATFSTTRLSLLDRGFAFAICHIRGGEELGRDWYENGKLLHKKNTFNDFIDCSFYFINENYCTSNSLFAMGGSAGGLLMGTVINMHPELYKGIIAAVPFVDVLTTMMDASIPLTTGEYDEWGNPEEQTYYEYILSYSPYDNLSKSNYPNILVTTGLHDSQVQYWEPAKWVARLRENNTGNNLILLHTNMDAGHGGASGRFNSLKELALEYAFVIDLAGKIEHTV